MPRTRRDIVMPILAAMALAQGVAPWLALWLADRIGAEIPLWAMWVVLGAAPVTGAAALLVRLLRMPPPVTTF